MTRLLPEQQLLQQIRTIPALTGAPLELLRTLEAEEHEDADLSQIVRAEPALAVCLLRMLGRDDEKRLSVTANLDAAVIAAGDETIARVARRVQPRTRTSEVSEREQSELEQRLWEHSVSVAVLTRALAKRSKTPGLNAEVAYCAGLLHNLGAIALQTLLPKEAVELAANWSSTTLTEAREQERAAFGADRWSFGWMLAELWQLPASLQDVFLFSPTLHEEGQYCPGDTEQLLALIHTAEHYVRELGRSTLPNASLWPVAPSMLELMSLDEAREELDSTLQAVTSTWVAAETDAETRTGLLESTSRDLARSLQRAEDDLYAAQSVAGVLRYGLKRLGDGDPVPGLLFRTMEFLGFRRMCHLEVDEANGEVSVHQSVVLGSLPRVEEGRVVSIAQDSFPKADVVTTRSKYAEAHELLTALGVESCVVAPIHNAGKECAGYICADRGPDGPPVCPGEQEGLDVIAEQAGLLLEHERLTLELQKLATQDPLTGAATRRRLMDRLDFLIKQARRTKWPLGLLLMDLDFFKKFNDTMGHQVGDQLLQDLVKVLNANTRKGDLVARYGGEEFVVLLPGAETEDARAAAEKLRSAVYDFGKANGEKYNHMSISISIGLAQLTAEDTSTTLIGRADEALYQAKENGRNRVELAA